MPLPSTVRMLALAAGLPLLLAGCDAGKILIDPKAMARRIEGFGLATRREVATDENGTVYELAVESTRESNWTQADRAIRRDLPHACPDGRRHDTLSQAPLADKADRASYEQMHPAGTTFVSTVRCAARPAFEFDLPAGTDWPTGSRLVEERLAAGLPSRPGQLRAVMPVRYWRQQPKYTGLENFLGMILAGAVERCPEGYRIDRIVLGNFITPPNGQPARPDEGHVALGLATSCAADDPPAAP